MGSRPQRRCSRNRHSGAVWLAPALGSDDRRDVGTREAVDTPAGRDPCSQTQLGFHGMVAEIVYPFIKQPAECNLQVHRSM